MDALPSPIDLFNSHILHLRGVDCRAITFLRPFSRLICGGQPRQVPRYVAIVVDLMLTIEPVRERLGV